MIDPLLSAAMPLPARAPANDAFDALSGAPSFLQWALTSPVPGKEGDALPQQGQHDPQLDAIVDPSRLEIGVGLEASGEIATLDALQALQWRDRLSSVVEFHVRNPQGERELVAMPWRLMASGALAQSRGGHGFVDPAGTTTTSIFDPVAAKHAATPQAVSVVGNASAAGLRSDAAGATATVLQPATLRAVETDDPMPLPSLPSSSPAAAEWLARWMKWIERDGRDPIVLLRDFRIDDDEARRVIDSLRAFAQEHGVGLDRIVVNGREFWRRPDLSQQQE
ncbi:MAG: hypothetical protein WAZ48_03970 [Lysobacteraceae bacterium]